MKKLLLFVLALVCAVPALATEKEETTVDIRVSVCQEVKGVEFDEGYPRQIERLTISSFVPKFTAIFPSQKIDFGALNVDKLIFECSVNQGEKKNSQIISISPLYSPAKFKISMDESLKFTVIRTLDVE